ncbi:hypothetical protein LSI54_08180 [Nesterenkonia sp. AY15]|uniref:hypothetical protein n=1 Tax=Nesterenkonia sp. AY15 TaxID=2901139 RepID=UPI001F4CCF0A|nr:hypothetical protein [Nesterenkonia sp. AY15]MCH8571330.1 hypothetical protein [Nesterenkonia sp. AY15]
MAMGSAGDPTSLAEQGRRSERRRHAERFRDPRDPSRRLIARFASIDWNAPQEYSTFKSNNILLIDAAKKGKAVSREVHNGYRTFTRNGRVIGGFYQLTTSLTSDLAKTVVRSRPLVKDCLESAGVPTSIGRGFAVGDLQGACDYMHDLGGSVTVKPEAGRRGDGISTGVASDQELTHAWNFAQPQEKTPLWRAKNILVEQFVPGVDIRVYIVGEAVVGALARLPLFIVGDGRSNVATLTRAAVAARSRNAFLAETPPDISADALYDLDLDPLETLPVGELRDVSGTSNPKAGGVTLDVTENLSDPLRRLAVDALWAIPGLPAGGVDLRVSDLSQTATAVVTDVTDSADMSLHRYPAFGTWRSPAPSVVAQMLAESAA